MLAASGSGLNMYVIAYLCTHTTQGIVVIHIIPQGISGRVFLKHSVNLGSSVSQDKVWFQNGSEQNSILNPT